MTGAKRSVTAKTKIKNLREYSYLYLTPYKTAMRSILIQALMLLTKLKF